MSNIRPLLITVDSLRLGGAETMLVNLVNRLDRAKFSTTVVSLSDDNPLAARIEPGAAELIALPRRFRYDFRPVSRIGDLIQRKRIRASLSFDMFDFFFVRLALLQLRVQQPTFLLSMHRTRPENLKDYLQTFAYSRMLNGCRIVSVSSQQAEYLSMRYRIAPERFRTIHNGIDVQYFDPALISESKAQIRQRIGIPESASVILQVANFGIAKRHQDSFLALRMLRTVNPELKVVLALVGGGSSAREAELRLMSERLGVADAVLFLGVHRDVRPLYRMADCFTLSSFTESFSISALEAMAMGLPCVLTDVGGAREMVREGIDGFVTPMGDPKALAEKWIMLLSSAQVLSSQEIREHIVQRFSVENCVGEYQTLLLE